MSSDNDNRSSDENLYSRLRTRDDSTRRNSLREPDRRARSSSRNLVRLNEAGNDRITRTCIPTAPFTEILAEIETARFAITVAFKKVLLGTQAILQPECAEPGAGPPEVDYLLESVRLLASKMHGNAGGKTGFYMRDPPPADQPLRQSAASRLASYTSHGARYLFPGKSSGSVGFGVAIACDDRGAIQIDNIGRATYPFMMSIGVAPFIAMPPDGMLAAARENEQRYRDRAGHGFHLPTYVEAYADFLAFAVQETPAALGALLLHEKHPEAAQELLDEHDKLTAKISSTALYFLGYEETGLRPGAPARRSLRDSEVARSCGMSLVDALVDWMNQCCRSAILGAFADSYRDLRIDKVADVHVRQIP